MKDVKAALAKLTADLAAEEGSIQTLVEAIPGIVQAAVTEALAAAGADNEVIAKAVEDADKTVQAHIEKLSAAAATAVPAPGPAEEPAPEPEPPAPLTFNGPTSITGASPTPFSGQFSASGGTGPYTFEQDGALGDFTTAADGFYAMNPESPMIGSVNIVVTDSGGNKTDPALVSISVS